MIKMHWWYVYSYAKDKVVLKLALIYTWEFHIHSNICYKRYSMKNSWKINIEMIKGIHFRPNKELFMSSSSFQCFSWHQSDLSPHVTNAKPPSSSILFSTLIFFHSIFEILRHPQALHYGRPRCQTSGCGGPRGRTRCTGRTRSRP